MRKSRQDDDGRRVGVRFGLAFGGGLPYASFNFALKESAGDRPFGRDDFARDNFETDLIHL